MSSVAALLLSVSIILAPAVDDPQPSLIGVWDYQYSDIPGQIRFYSDGYYESNHREYYFRGSWYINIHGDIVLRESGITYTFRLTKRSRFQLSGVCLETKFRVVLTWLP